VEVLARAFYAMHDTRTPVLVGAAAMILNVAFSVLFSALFARIGWLPHGGLALANSLATALEAAGLIFYMRRRLGGMQGAYILKGSLQAVAGALGMALGLWIWLGQIGAAPAWLIAAGGILIGGVIYTLAIWRMGVREVNIAMRVISKYIPRK
jgi:putative peptidoglycan lipid II flippase